MDPSDNGSLVTRLGRSRLRRGFVTWLAVATSYSRAISSRIIAYFYGEDSNLTALFGKKGPEVPDGYNFDYFNADALIHKLSVADGQLATQSGMRYRVLALDPQQPAHVATGPAQDSGSGAGGRDRGGSQAYGYSKPERRRERIPEYRGRVVGLRHGRARLRERQSLRGAKSQRK